MALSYKEFLEKKLREQTEAASLTKEKLDTAELTKEIYERKRRKNNKKRPFSQDTLINRLHRK